MYDIRAIVLSRAWSSALVALADVACIGRDALALSAIMARVVMVYAPIPCVVAGAILALTRG